MGTRLIVAHHLRVRADAYAAAAAAAVAAAAATAFHAFLRHFRFFFCFDDRHVTQADYARANRRLARVRGHDFLSSTVRVFTIACRKRFAFCVARFVSQVQTSVKQNAESERRFV